MKKYIRASQYQSRTEISRGGSRYSVHYSTFDNETVVFTMIKLAPYDEADYVWAKCDGNVVKFIQSGKVIDKMTLPWYSDCDDYVMFDSFVDDIFNNTADELNSYNHAISPIIVHN